MRVVIEVKCPRKNVRGGDSPVENVLGKCPRGDNYPRGEMSRGEISRREMSRGKCHEGWGMS